MVPTAARPLRRACAPGHIVEQPAIGGGEVGIEKGAGQALDHRAWPSASSLRQIGAAPVLPDDGVRSVAARPLPHDRGLALIGDADGRPSVAASLAADGEGRLPDLLRVMLDPAVGRKDLRQLALRHGADMPFAVEDDGARAGRALVDGENVPGSHRVPAAQCARSMAKSTASRSAALSGVSGKRPSASRAMAP